MRNSFALLREQQSSLFDEPLDLVALQLAFPHQLLGELEHDGTLLVHELLDEAVGGVHDLLRAVAGGVAGAQDARGLPGTRLISPGQRLSHAADDLLRGAYGKRPTEVRNLLILACCRSRLRRP